jgi:hypothetical protein
MAEKKYELPDTFLKKEQAIKNRILTSFKINSCLPANW